MANQNNFNNISYQNANIGSIVIKNNIVYFVHFYNNEYLVYSSIHDDYIKSKVTKLLFYFSIQILIFPVNTSKNDIDLFKKFNVIVLNNDRTDIKSSTLDTLQIKSLQLLKSYFKHGLFIEYKNENSIGYIDKFVVKKIRNIFTTYVNSKSLYDLNILGKKSELTANIMTGFGKEILLSWIKEPLNNIVEIENRIKIHNSLLIFMPKIKKLLKKCKILMVSDNLNFNKLKLALKSTLILKNIVGNLISLENYKKYKKLYKILKIVENNSIKKGSDKKLDKLVEIYQNIPFIINEMSGLICKKYKIDLNVVYLPEIGFLIETDADISNSMFKIKDKKYLKTSEMKELDIKIGKIYEKIKERTIKIVFKIKQKILRTNFNYFYNFIGELDAYLSLINYSLSFKGNFPSFKDAGDSQKNLLEINADYLTLNTMNDKKRENLNRFEDSYSSFKNKQEFVNSFNNTEKNCKDYDQLSFNVNKDIEIYIKKSDKYSLINLNKNSIILNDHSVISFLAKKIILAQIGCKLNNETATLSIYDNILIKLDTENNFSVKESSFLNEVNMIDDIIRTADSKSICFIQNIGQYTNLEFGYLLFETVLEYLKNFSVIISTNYYLQKVNEHYKSYKTDLDSKSIVEYDFNKDKILLYNDFSSEFLKVVRDIQNELNKN